MLDAARISAIDAVTQRACNILRHGPFDLQGYRDVILGILTLKFLTDIQVSGPRRLDHDDATAFSSPLRHLELPTTADFHALLARGDERGLGDRLDAAVYALATANREQLDGIQGVRFSTARLGEAKERDRVLAQLMSVVGNDQALDFRPADANAFAAAAYASDALLTSMAGTLGKRGVEFYTPAAVSRLLAELVEPRGGDSIMDPCCGTGGMLIACSQLTRQAGDNAGCELYGQEINGETIALARLNMVMHNENRITLAWGDVLQDPKFLASDQQLRTFDVVLSSPPYNVSGWLRGTVEIDHLGRFWRGLPPATSANYAFISHMVESMSPHGGRMAVVMPLGALFRGGAEAQIRRRLLEENLFDAVIALPAKLMPSTSIPVAVLVLRRNKQDEGVMFIDGSSFFAYGKTQNILGLADVQRIVSVYRDRSQSTSYARLVTLQEIAENEFNLNVSRYLQVQAEEEQVDLDALRAERVELQAELHHLEARLAALRQDTTYG